MRQSHIIKGFTVVFIAIYGKSYNPGDHMVGDYMWTTMKYIPIFQNFATTRLFAALPLFGWMAFTRREFACFGRRSSQTCCLSQFHLWTADFGKGIKWWGQVKKTTCFSSPPASFFSAASLFLLFFMSNVFMSKNQQASLVKPIAAVYTPKYWKFSLLTLCVYQN